MAEKKVIEIVDKAVRIITQKIQYATSTLAGILKLTGDLGGTYDNPYVVNTHLTNPLPLSQGGTGSNLESSGPGVLIQTGSSQPVTVEDPLSPGRGGTGKANIGKINMPEDGTPINLEGDGTWDNSGYIPYFISKYKLDKWQSRNDMLRKTATLPSDEILQGNGSEIVTSTGINKSDLGRLSQANTWTATQKFTDGVWSAEGTLWSTNSVLTFTPPSNNYMLFLLPRTSGGTPYAIIAVYNNGANTVIVASSSNTVETLNNTVLTGTTGATNKVTVSHASGTLYIENRLSYGIDYVLFYMTR